MILLLTVKYRETNQNKIKDGKCCSRYISKARMNINISQKLFLFAFIILTINGILGYAVYKSNQKVLNSEQWVQHTEQVIYQSANLSSIGKDMETALRCFVVTRDSAYLEPLNNAQKTASVNIGQLKQLTRDNPSQQQRIDSLNFYIHKLPDFSFKPVKLKSEHRLAPVIPYTSAGQDQYYSSRISQIIKAIQLEEGTLLKQRKQTNERSEKEFNQFSLGIFILMTGFTILLVIVAGKYLYQNREKAKRAAELVIANQELLFQNEEKEKRAAELTVANLKLLFQNEEKEKRAAELTIANAELSFQNEEKEKRAAELKLAEAVRITMLNELMKRNKDLEQFAYIVSHNLRAPVANIIGASSALSEEGLSTDDREILSNGISVSIIKLDEVVKDLNLILQVKGGINEVKEIVHFPELVYDIKNSIKNLIDGDDIEIRYDFSEIDKFLSLKAYLYSIFFNLISNSVKYRRQDIHSIIKIKSHLRKNKIELIFTDNGMGIDLQKKGEQVFGLYKRFHTNTEGRGMGLFMVKTQVETLGGKISIKSAENKGTEFLIEFEI